MPAHLLFTTIDSRIRFAIAHRRLLEVLYNGRRRVVEPHDYGLKGGRARLLAFQLRVLSPVTVTSRAGWRLLDVEKIAACEVMEETFAGTRQQAHEDHLSWDTIFARVE